MDDETLWATTQPEWAPHSHFTLEQMQGVFAVVQGRVNDDLKLYHLVTYGNPEVFFTEGHQMNLAWRIRQTPG